MLGQVNYAPSDRKRRRAGKVVKQMSNKVYISNQQNTVKVPSGLRILIRRSCNAVLGFEKFEQPAEISVTFVDNAAIAALNEQYRNKPMPTDVLSFPLGENGKYDINEDTGCAMLGDIVISMEKAMEQADHEAGGLEAVKMREKEEAVLIQLGLPRTVSYTADQV